MNGEATGTGELLKSNSFESLPERNRKGFIARWSDGDKTRGQADGCDVKEQEETEKKNEIHRDIGWQLTRTLKTSSSDRKPNRILLIARRLRSRSNHKSVTLQSGKVIK